MNGSAEDLKSELAAVLSKHDAAFTIDQETRKKDVLDERNESFSKREREKELQKIEFEEVKIRVPKKVMDYLRSMEKALEMTPTEWLEETIVDNVRADLEAVTGDELIETFGLSSIFRTILNDKRY